MALAVVILARPGTPRAVLLTHTGGMTIVTVLAVISTEHDAKSALAHQMVVAWQSLGKKQGTHGGYP